LMPRNTRVLVRAAAIIAVVVMVLATIGCRSSELKQTNVVSLKDYRITGSYACLPLLKLLTTEYSKSHLDIRFTYLPGSSSTAAFTGIKDGTIDIGAISRGPTEPGEESPGAVQKTLSRDALVFATHKDVNVYNLTDEQLRLIYSGAISNWKDVGGPDSPIVVLDRAENETVKEIVRQHCLGQTVITSSATILYSEPDMNKALELTSGSIGYVSYGGYKTLKLPFNIPKHNNAYPGVETVDDGSYTMTRTLGLVVDKDAGNDVKDFVAWTGSKEAKSLMEKNGYAAAD
jgi:phosphate transport system substrate-binding protein